MNRIRRSILTAFFTLLLLPALLTAQTIDYTTHVIKEGETLSALAKQNGTTVGDIMRLNKMDTKSILKVGEKIKIPAKGVKVPAATATPTTKPVVAAPAETPAGKQVQPVATITHTVQKGESLYHISKQYKVPVAELKKWNNLTSDNIKIGQVLAVNGPAVVTTSVKAVTEHPATTVSVPVVPKEDKPVVVAPPIVKPVETAPVVTKDTVVFAPEHKDTAKPIIIKEEKPLVTVPETKPAETNVVQPAVNTANISSEGFFAPLFGKEVEGRSLQTATGAAMTFKTASGWADKKYYILMNNIPPGSIVKITTADNKSVYAKVLWALGEMKENEGLNYRISSAAASVLGISDAKFNLTVSFYE